MIIYRVHVFVKTNFSLFNADSCEHMITCTITMGERGMWQPVTIRGARGRKPTLYLHEHKWWMTPFQLLGFQPSQKQADVAKLESSVDLLLAWNVFTCLDSVQHVCTSIFITLFIWVFTSFRKNITFVNTPICPLQQAVQCPYLFPVSWGPVHFSWSVAQGVKILFFLLWTHWWECHRVVLPCHCFGFLWHRTWDYWNQWACRNLLNWNVYLVVPIKEKRSY